MLGNYCGYLFFQVSNARIIGQGFWKEHNGIPNLRFCMAGAVITKSPAAYTTGLKNLESKHGMITHH